MDPNPNYMDPNFICICFGKRWLCFQDGHKHIQQLHQTSTSTIMIYSRQVKAPLENLPYKNRLQGVRSNKLLTFSKVHQVQNITHISNKHKNELFILIRS